ncbi:MAG: thioredoxin family protein [Candidatus Latescibacteria bacterium]|nr:thioredoxin family protein [Candidatus Latescibacterota bacterium]
MRRRFDETNSGLWHGCPKCNQLEANAKAAVQGLGCDVEVIKVTDVNAIADAGVMITPALAIDGEVRVS